jgi:hypothetical protein
MSKTEIATIDATPNKRIYLSIIADYGLATALCELIENAYDCWNHPGIGQDLKIDIALDVAQQKITIADTAGGGEGEGTRKTDQPRSQLIGRSK